MRVNEISCGDVVAVRVLAGDTWHPTYITKYVLVERLDSNAVVGDYISGVYLTKNMQPDKRTKVKAHFRVREIREVVKKAGA